MGLVLFPGNFEFRFEQNEQHLIQMKSLLRLCVLTLAILSVVQGDVGNNLFRTFLVFNEQPLDISDAEAAGMILFIHYIK